MGQRHTLTMLTRKWLNTIAYLQKKIKPLAPESELQDFYHPSKNQKNGELLFVAVGTSIATYPLCKYLK